MDRSPHPAITLSAGCRHHQFPQLFQAEKRVKKVALAREIRFRGCASPKAISIQPLEWFFQGDTDEKWIAGFENSRRVSGASAQY
jgi:hypothetical protein